MTTRSGRLSANRQRFGFCGRRRRRSAGAEVLATVLILRACPAGGAAGAGLPARFAEASATEGRERIETMLTNATMLKRTATLEDVGNAAAVAASDNARTMTAATINVSCGALIDP